MSAWNDFNDAEQQQTFDLIPKGTVAKVRMTIKPGGYDDPNQGWTGGYATQSFETGSKAPTGYPWGGGEVGRPVPPRWRYRLVVRVFSCANSLLLIRVRIHALVGSKAKANLVFCD
jgi:hypothetical protein